MYILNSFQVLVRHVHEGYTLLNKSLIEVEMPNITLDDDENLLCHESMIHPNNSFNSFIYIIYLLISHFSVRVNVQMWMILKIRSSPLPSTNTRA